MLVAVAGPHAAAGTAEVEVGVAVEASNSPATVQQQSLLLVGCWGVLLWLLLLC
jgi:hypothetical protein